MAVRDEKGRFVKGYAGGPGRPSRKVETDLQAALTEQTRQRWQAIVKAAIDQAISGNVYAMRFLAEYTIGKPPSVLELRAADAAALSEVLKALEARGLSPSDVFNAMLQEIVEAESEAGQDEQ
jgi:hypothetical protein